MTDPIASMLQSIKNGSKVSNQTAVFPFSKLKLSILEVLKEEGLVAGVEKKTKKGHPIIEIALAYDASGLPKVKDVTRISKPSRRVYLGAKEIFPVKNGKGMIVLSTPKGIMTGTKARKEMVGGEVLFKLW
ncbi:MAG: 30S ribosomal protein S8 [Candidatus Pacebacteria bacterium]|jgi:small subunit ribosomal protein S8|nr:30S ribosomal protein S8 [Candidatus Paceibacterota bacterium]MBP9058459.1 30S ribosomal protein S8 [Candidatus Paceibacterota bacterium]MBP9769935.1 30S ribosomal protein S8 [Candidatus Paceibacterota bacterium]